MSSPPKADGVSHPQAATKVGGMRIVQHKEHLKDKKAADVPVSQPEDESLKVSTSPSKSALTAVSGALQKGHADFPKEAVKSFHEKPLPTRDISAPANPPKGAMNISIQQPRKF